MPLQSSGAISFSDIATEFSDAAPHSMSEFYGAASGIPASGVIDASDFYGASAVPPRWHLLLKTPNLSNHYYMTVNYPETDTTNLKVQHIWLNRSDPNALLRHIPLISPNVGQLVMTQETPSSSIKLYTSQPNTYFPSQAKMTTSSLSTNYTWIQQPTAATPPATATFSNQEGNVWLSVSQIGYNNNQGFLYPTIYSNYYEPANLKPYLSSIPRSYYEYNTANEPADTLGTDNYDHLYKNQTYNTVSMAKTQALAATNFYTETRSTCGTAAPDGITYLGCTSGATIGEITTGNTFTYDSQMYDHAYWTYDTPSYTNSYGNVIAASYSVSAMGLYESGNTAYIIYPGMVFSSITDRDAFVAAYPTVDSIGAAMANGTLNLYNGNGLNVAIIDLTAQDKLISGRWTSASSPAAFSERFSNFSTYVGGTPLGGVVYGYQEGDTYP